MPPLQRFKAREKHIVTFDGTGRAATVTAVRVPIVALLTAAVGSCSIAAHCVPRLKAGLGPGEDAVDVRTDLPIIVELGVVVVVHETTKAERVRRAKRVTDLVRKRLPRA